MGVIGTPAKVIGAIGLGLLGREILRQSRSIDLNGRTVLITGSSRGLGLAMAEEFAGRGANLVLCARDEPELDWARETVAKHGTEVLAVPCDVGDREQVQRMIDQATDRFGTIDVLVNTAGIITVGPVADQTLHDFEQSMNVMFWGVVYPSLAVLPSMRERRDGRIVNITSIGGKVSVPHLLSYSSAKFAAVGFSEGLSAEVAKDGVRVLTVVPGLMRTGSHVNAYFKGKNRLEFGWFSVGASSPVTAISARRAARQIVDATVRGDQELILSWQAQLLARFHGIAPGLTTSILSLVNRALPDAGGAGEERRRGWQSESMVSESFVTALGRRAGHELHQYPQEHGIDAAVAEVPHD